MYPDSEMTPEKLASGQLGGNFFNKYNSRNPIIKLMMHEFLSSFDDLVTQTGATRILELGCGEGHLCQRLASRGFQVLGVDSCRLTIDQAQARLSLYRQDHPGSILSLAYQYGDVYSPPALTPNPDLVICCEVLEHLAKPEQALEAIQGTGSNHFLFSVPKEPLWRALNLTRLKYIKELGNTPGHIQHWSSRAFRRLLQSRFKIVQERNPLPWTMILCTNY